VALPFVAAEGALLLASRPSAFDPDAALMRRSTFAQGRSCRRGGVQPHR
jgi:hypothetical protein